MRGKYSKNKFFQQFPQIIQIYFQGSKFTQTEDVERIFRKANNAFLFYQKKYKKEDLPIIMLLFDKLGIVERSKNNPLSILNHKLDNEKEISFVGLSNYSLDAAKINRALVLQVPDLEKKLDELIETSYTIAESISSELRNEPIFKIISNTYFKYKKELQIIKELGIYKQYISIMNKAEKMPLINPQNDQVQDSQNYSFISINDDSDKINEREKRQFSTLKNIKELKNL